MDIETVGQSFPTHTWIQIAAFLIAKVQTPRQIFKVQAVIILMKVTRWVPDAALRVSPVTLGEVIVALMTIAGVTSSVGQPTVKIIIQGPQHICKLRSSGLLRKVHSIYKSTCLIIFQELLHITRLARRHNDQCDSELIVKQCWRMQ